MANSDLALADGRIAVVEEASDATELTETLARVAYGDRDAFEEVYRRTAAKLLGVCLQTLPRRAEAEDALQDVYCSVWRSAAQFDRHRGSAMTWLITIARNRSIDQLRRSRPGTSAPLALARTLADPRPLPCQMLSADQEYRKMRLCLDLLSERDATALKNAFFGGSTYAELAMAAGIPVGTMKSRMRRALLQIRDGMS